MPKPPDWYFEMMRIRQAAAYLGLSFYEAMDAPTFLIDRAIMSENAENQAAQEKARMTRENKKPIG